MDFVSPVLVAHTAAIRQTDSKMLKMRSPRGSQAAVMLSSTGSSEANIRPVIDETLASKAVMEASKLFIRLTTSSVDKAGAPDRFSRIKRSSSSAELTPDVHQFGHEPAAFPKSIQCPSTRALHSRIQRSSSSSALPQNVYELWPETTVSSRSTGSASVDGTAIERRAAIQAARSRAATAQENLIRRTSSGGVASAAALSFIDRSAGASLAAASPVSSIQRTSPTASRASAFRSSTQGLDFILSTIACFCLFLCIGKVHRIEYGPHRRPAEGGGCTMSKSLDLHHDADTPMA